MQDLRLVGIHEDGEHVLLAGADGTRYRVPVDDALRAATRRDRTPTDHGDEAREPAEPMRPRDVQALIRAGVSVVEVAERSGWTEDKVRRYEPPIRAEREYVAGLARGVQLRGRTHDGSLPTLGARAALRLDERGVEAERVVWDSWKTESGAWTVVCIFPAGGRERRATWRFEPRDRTLSPADDEARWLGEDEQAQAPGPIPASTPARPARRVYDVEAEGGLQAKNRHPAGKSRAARPTPAPTDVPAPAPEATADTDAEPLDLMSAMRERSAARRKKPARREPAPTDTSEDMPEDARPVERLHLADTPPPMGSHPAPQEVEHASQEIYDEDDASEADTAAADLFGDIDEDSSAETADEHDDSAPDDDDSADDDDVAPPVPARQSGSRRGRPAVPSWDDIMFGTRPSSEH
ncbi:septation protein SepH [Luteipulveratus halotolerans]|uniref:septation protein SepH n=1 Tax=Luteipulveratus halotolerans TaxID=1631356 RepID=UPI000682C131|nr:septation protein SepH [Luteipulveratus halotolerans]